MQILYLSLLLFCFFLLIIFLLFYAWSALFSAPYYPANTKKIERALENFNVNLANYSNFIDLGSGDGRVVRWASTKGLNATGIEINPFFVFLSKLIRLFSTNRNKQHFQNANFHNVNLENYDVVYLYLFPEVLDKLENKIFSETKPGSLVISNTFVFKNKKPIFTDGKILIYKT